MLSGRIISRVLLFFFAISLTFPGFSYSQCCSTGSPVGASVYVGVLGKNYLRAIAYYRRSYSDTYYQGAQKTSETVQLSNSSFNFSGVAIAYGVTKRLTIETDAGYYFDKTQNFINPKVPQTKGYGLSNGSVTVKYGAFIKPASQVEITAGAGFRYPFSAKPQVIDGVQLNRDVQPSTNAFGASAMLFLNKGFPAITLRLFSINRYDYNFRDRSDYKYGNILLNSVFVSKKIVKYFFGIIQVRNEWKTNDQDFANPNNYGGDKVINSGFQIVTVSPQLSYSIAGKWNLTVLCDIPVYKYYNGKQMTPQYSFAVSLTRDFYLGGKQPKIDPGIVK
ncbi:MAG: hypothetical protein NT004_19020 [Bacteroidetes bacterium]|nr:hypothetical protein [Bacteroidota bacterium]